MDFELHVTDFRMKFWRDSKKKLNLHICKAKNLLNGNNSNAISDYYKR